MVLVIAWVYLPLKGVSWISELPCLVQSMSCFPFWSLTTTKVVHEVRLSFTYLNVCHLLLTPYTEVKSRTGGSYFVVRWSWWDQRRIPGLRLDYTERGRRDLCTDYPFPEIMILVYWLKVNSSVTIFTDHLWCIPFRDQRFQCILLSAIIAFRIWAWFLVRTVEIRESLLNVSICLSLKSSFNHCQSSLSCCLITLQINLSHGLSSGLIPYVTVCDWVTLRHIFDLGF